MGCHCRQMGPCQVQSGPIEGRHRETNTATSSTALQAPVAGVGTATIPTPGTEKVIVPNLVIADHSGVRVAKDLLLGMVPP